MHDDLQRYLDGELPWESLAPELRAEAEAWDRLTDAALDMTAERAPADMVARVLARLPAAPGRSPWRRALDWALQPRELHVRPVYGLLAAAALAGVLVLGDRTTTAGPTMPDEAQSVEAPNAQSPGAAAAAREPIVYVRFSFRAPDATSVTLAGDFNEWQAVGLALSDADGDGVWSGTFALQPGVHKYMFVVDGEHWETDPGAERYMDDGFGMRNALIAITPPVRRTI